MQTTDSSTISEAQSQRNTLPQRQQQDVQPQRQQQQQEVLSVSAEECGLNK